jgi:2-dehydropantoate 2-reductase
MRFVMLGAGAIGGVVGGQLARAGFDVLFVDPLQEHVDAINRDGLHLRGVHGHHVLRVPAVTDVSAVSPHNRLLLDLITEMARGRERPGRYTLCDLRARRSP